MADTPENAKEFSKFVESLSEDQAAEIIRSAKMATGGDALGEFIEYTLFGDWRKEAPKSKSSSE